MKNNDIFNNSYNLFKKDIKPDCFLCEYSVNKDDDILCSKLKKIVKSTNSCSYFLYCPLKRKPKKRMHLTCKFKEEDFKI